MKEKIMKKYLMVNAAGIVVSAYFHGTPIKPEHT